MAERRKGGPDGLSIIYAACFAKLVFHFSCNQAKIDDLLRNLIIQTFLSSQAFDLDIFFPTVATESDSSDIWLTPQFLSIAVD